MKCSICHNILLAGLSFLLLISCDLRPEPSVPQLSDVSLAIQIDTFWNSVTFAAELDGPAADVTQCGFVMEAKDGSQQKLECSLEGNAFKSETLWPDKEESHVVRAYVGNGVNVKYSDPEYLHTVKDASLCQELSMSVLNDGYHMDVTLVAKLEHIVDDVTECGFLIETEHQESRRVRCLLFDGNEFRADISEFEYDTPYTISAFIGNGVKVKYSATETLHIVHDPQCLILEYNYVEVPAEYYYVFVVGVDTEYPYDVIIPEDAGWVAGVAKVEEDATCCVNISPNFSVEERSCDLLFQSIDKVCSQTLHIRQAGR